MHPARTPSLPLPQPLRAREQGTFTEVSVVQRLPEIARRTLAENAFPPETAARIQALIAEIPHGRLRPVSMPDDPCEHAWEAWLAPYLGQNWLDIPWFLAEEYFYARILEATGYFESGAWARRDPYAHQKRLGLQAARPDLPALAGQVEAAMARPKAQRASALADLLLVDLWGNQKDLSMWPVQAGAAPTSAPDPHSAGGNGQVLCDERALAAEHLAGLGEGKAQVDLLLDNAGHELAVDLALADYLLSSGLAAQVVLHAKCYPVFVSDALDTDIHATIDFLAWEGSAATRAMAIRLREALVGQRLRIARHPFWTSPLPVWEMPETLRSELAQSALLIAKGDANYRRLLGDRHWPYHLSLGDVLGPFPCAVLALRTLKSEITTGVPAGRVPTSDPQWMTNGRWGLAQFARAAHCDGADGDKKP
jgi:uncharacterized protein with ATP-grasp and redox domains